MPTKTKKPGSGRKAGSCTIGKTTMAALSVAFPNPTDVVYVYYQYAVDKNVNGVVGVYAKDVQEAALPPMEVKVENFDAPVTPTTTTSTT